MTDNRSLYVSRPLLNTDELRQWAKAQGFASTLAPGDLHVTIAFSRDAVDWDALEPMADTVAVEGGARSVEEFGGKALVLLFASPELSTRWQEFRDAGASWDWEGYRPHVTLTYDGAPSDLAAIVAYTGPLKFGPEVFAEIDDGWPEAIDEADIAKTRAMKMDPSSSAVHIDAPLAGNPKKKPKDDEMMMSGAAKVMKVDESLGVVFGWAMVCAEKGEPYYDTQSDHIPEDVMLKAAVDFMDGARIGKEMHSGDQAGTILFAWPVTTDISKAMGMTSDTTGLMIGYKPADKAMLAKFKDGSFTGFSIGGKAIREAVE